MGVYDSDMSCIPLWGILGLRQFLYRRLPICSLMLRSTQRDFSKTLHKALETYTTGEHSPSMVHLRHGSAIHG